MLREDVGLERAGHGRVVHEQTTVGTPIGVQRRRCKHGEVRRAVVLGRRPGCLRGRLRFQYFDGRRRRAPPLSEAGPVADAVLEVAHLHGFDLEGACEGCMACSTCHVIVDDGWFTRLDDPSEEEEDLLDKAWGLEQRSRLSCQIILDEEDLEIEIPKYNINMVSENPH